MKILHGSNWYLQNPKTCNWTCKANAQIHMCLQLQKNSRVDLTARSRSTETCFQGSQPNLSKSQMLGHASCMDANSCIHLSIVIIIRIFESLQWDHLDCVRTGPREPSGDKQHPSRLLPKFGFHRRSIKSCQVPRCHQEGSASAGKSVQHPPPWPPG